MDQFSRLDQKIVDEFSVFRGADKVSFPRYLCDAPFNNLAFDTMGNVGACFKSYFYDEKDLRYPNTSLHDIWFSPQFEKMREHIRNNDLNYKCSGCKKYLEDRNFVAAPILNFSEYEMSPLSEYPLTLELELSNTCNLECGMCSGDKSSKIRQNREKRPPLISPYDDRFVDQLKEFIPHLRGICMAGGEPLLSSINFKVWELVVSMNPGIRLTVTTNGTSLSRRFKELLELGNFRMIVSLDSLTPGVYEQIRVHSDLQTVLRNIEYYAAYSKRKDGALQLSICPMRVNWREIPDLVNFGNRHGIVIWLHTVHRAETLMLSNLDADQLEFIIDELARCEIKSYPRSIAWIERLNRERYDGFLKRQLPSWLNAQRQVANKNVAQPAPSQSRRETSS